MAKDAKGHGSDGRGGGGYKPIPNSPYHAKSDAELRYIAKDASEAATAAQSMGKLETKYNDQVNDASTVLGYRNRGGQSDHPDAVAARALASGPKSAPVTVHDSMREKIDYAHNPLGLSRSEVNKDGIPNVNRRGYGRIASDPTFERSPLTGENTGRRS